MATVNGDYVQLQQFDGSIVPNEVLGDLNSFLPPVTPVLAGALVCYGTGTATFTGAFVSVGVLTAQGSAEVTIEGATIEAASVTMTGSGSMLPASAVVTSPTLVMQGSGEVTVLGAAVAAQLVTMTGVGEMLVESGPMFLDEPYVIMQVPGDIRHSAAVPSDVFVRLKVP